MCQGVKLFIVILQSVIKLQHHFLPEVFVIKTFSFQEFEKLARIGNVRNNLYIPKKGEKNHDFKPSIFKIIC